MSAVRWDVGWGAVLLLSLTYFFDDTGLFAACIPAVLAHEFGHAAALKYYGANIRKVSVRIYGAKIDYSGILGRRERAASLAAGPAAGAAYSVLAYLLLGTFGKMSAAAGTVMTVFNALPIIPLDGGQILGCILPAARARKISLISSVLLCVVSLALLEAYSTAAPIAVAAALLANNLISDVRL